MRLSKIIENRGFATAMATWILFILLSLTLVVSQLMLSEIVVGANYLFEAKMYSAAEEGIAKAVKKLNEKYGNAPGPLQISEVFSWAKLAVTYGPNTANHVVISEVCYDPAGTDGNNEFLELYNPTDHPVTIGGWIIKQNNGGTWHTVGTITGGAMILPNKFYLCGKSNVSAFFGVAPDFTWADSNNLQNGADDAVGIFNGGTQVDLVGYGASAAAYEGSPAPDPSSTSIERKTSASGVNNTYGNAYDSDDNSVDFVARAAPSPQNSSTWRDLDPSMYSASTDAPHEFIELYNNTDYQVDIGTTDYYIKVRDGTAKKLVAFNAGMSTKINGRSIALVFESSADTEYIFNLSTNYNPSKTAFGNSSSYPDKVIYLTYENRNCTGLWVDGSGVSHEMNGEDDLKVELYENATRIDIMNNQQTTNPATGYADWRSTERKIMSYRNTGDWSIDKGAWRGSLYEGGTPGYACENAFYYGDDWATLTRDSSGNAHPIDFGDPDDKIKLYLNVVDCSAGVPVNSEAFTTSSDWMSVINKLQPYQGYTSAYAQNLVTLKPWYTQGSICRAPPNSKLDAGKMWIFNPYSRTGSNFINVNTADTPLLAGIGYGPQGLSDGRPIAKAIAAYRLGADGIEGSSDDQYITDRSHLYKVLRAAGISDADASNYISSPLLRFTSDGAFRVIAKATREKNAGDIDLENKLLAVVRLAKRSTGVEFALLSFQEEYKDKYPAFRYMNMDDFFGN